MRAGALRMAHSLLTNTTRLVRPPSPVPLPAEELTRHVRDRKVVYLGETHGEPAVVGLHTAVLNTLVSQAEERGSNARVSVFMEHFSLEHQDLLDRFQAGEVKEEELQEQYDRLGDEGFLLAPYSPLLRLAKKHSKTVKLKGGFVPKRYAKILMKEGEEEAYKQVIEAGYMDPEDKIKGSEQHYDFFESLLTGRRVGGEEPGEQWRRIFPAQVLKDCVMAATIKKGLDEQSSDDTALVIAGSGHLDYGLGVPERVGHIDGGQCLITSRDEDLVEEGIPEVQGKGFPLAFPGDLVLIYREGQGGEAGEGVKEEVARAYDRVASTAEIQGDLDLAARVMGRLGYSPEQISVAGRDGANYQGVGCPHPAANIQEGDFVLDVGSGLGVDSFIAAAATGEEEGMVVGLDISPGEVRHATARAESRGVAHVKFVAGDMEKMPLPDATFDVVISNGAFCLAPDKERAFKEVFRVLKPGGRFSICCTTLQEKLDPGVNWPLCMRVFLPLEAAGPMLTAIGFEGVKVDTSDSKMTLEVDGGDEPQEGAAERRRIHGNSAEFQHLEQHDMDQLCARVVLTGVKPQ